MSINSFKIDSFGTPSAFDPNSIHNANSSSGEGPVGPTGPPGTGGISATGNCYSDYLYWDPNTTQWEAGSEDVHIGCEAGFANQGSNSIAVGSSAANSNQGSNAIAIGTIAGTEQQGSHSVAIGFEAAATSQADFAVAIGYGAGLSNQGTQSIAIGFGAGAPSPQAANSIAINAAAAPLEATTANALFVKPIRQSTNLGLPFLRYNPTTGEIVFIEGP